MVTGDVTWSGEHTIQYTDDVLQNCVPETCIILLTSVTLVNSIKIKNKIYAKMKTVKFFQFGNVFI